MGSDAARQRTTAGSLGNGCVNTGKPADRCTRAAPQPCTNLIFRSRQAGVNVTAPPQGSHSGRDTLPSVSPSGRHALFRTAAVWSCVRDLKIRNEGCKLSHVHTESDCSWPSRGRGRGMPRRGTRYPSSKPDPPQCRGHTRSASAGT